MHMADALVVPSVAAAMYASSAAACMYSIKRVSLEDDSKKVPVMGVMGAFVFAAQMINFTIPGTGSSGHLCGGMLLSALLGPCTGFMTMVGVLLIQCLLFADGGLLALGCNIWNMAFYGCFVGALLIWKPIMGQGASKKKIIAASVLGCVLTLQMGAFSVTLETLFSHITELPFAAFVTAMQPIHLAIGIVEGLITAAVLCFVYETRPELLWGVCVQDRAGRISLKSILAVLSILTLLIGGGLSLAASSNPDGLEWSMEKVAGTTEIDAQGEIHKKASAMQETFVIFPDYGFRNSGSEAGTSVSGIAGAVIVAMFCAVLCLLFRLMRMLRKKTDSCKGDKG